MSEKFYSRNCNIRGTSFSTLFFNRAPTKMLQKYCLHTKKALTQEQTPASNNGLKNF